MAKNVINEKGFKILGLTTKECKDVGFGTQYFDEANNPYVYSWDLVCDNCNRLLTYEKEVYYIPVLNRVFDKDCLIDWYNNATYYPEDSRYEALKYDTISNYITNDGNINIKDL